MALCLVRAPDATMAAAMAAPSWIRWLGRGLAGTGTCPAGAESTGLRPRNPVFSLGVERDPLGPEAGQFRVIRGSSWAHGTITELRLSFRDFGEEPRDDVGFRVARYLED